MKRSILGLGLVVAAACGGSKSDSSSSSKAAAPEVKIDAAAVNALVPASLKDKLVFESQKIVEERGRHNRTYTLAAPKGWASRMKGFTDLKPPDNAGLGFFTSMHVGTNCDGSCEPKDWATVSEKVDFKPYRDSGKILKEDKTASSHVMIAEQGDKVYVVSATWEDGGREYHTCHAELEKEVKDAAPAFAKACEAVAMDED